MVDELCTCGGIGCMDNYAFNMLPMVDSVKEKGKWKEKARLEVTVKMHSVMRSGCVMSSLATADS